MRMAMMLSSESAVLFRPPALFYSSNHSRLPSRNPSPTLSFPLVNSRKNFDLHITTTAAATKQFRVKASISSQCPQNPTLRSSMPGTTEIVHTPPTNLTRTVTTIASLAFALTRLLLTSLKILPILPNPSLACAAGSLFFAAVDYRANPYLNTPLTVVATGLAWWLDIYSGVLMLRVLLSWFPNIPWDRQPLSAIRDLCDPYLNLFRNIIPPVFDTLDVSPLLAFAILGFLGPILRSSR